MSTNLTHAVSRALFFLIPIAALTAWALAAGAPALTVQSTERAAEEKTPWGSLRWLMSAKIDPKSNITLGIAEINPGKSNPLHVHDNCEEVVYVLSGSCEQRVGRETVAMKAGDVLHIPAGVPHTARALGDEPLRSVVAYNSGQRHFKAVDESSGEQGTAAEAEKIPAQLGKVRHVVLFKFKDGTTAEQKKTVEDAFRELPKKIPQIVSFEWGTNISPENHDEGFTHCFLVTFNDAKARDAYLPHPAHKAFGKVLHPYLDKVLVIDFVAKD